MACMHYCILSSGIVVISAPRQHDSLPFSARIQGGDDIDSVIPKNSSHVLKKWQGDAFHVSVEFSYTENTKADCSRENLINAEQ